MPPPTAPPPPKSPPRMPTTPPPAQAPTIAAPSLVTDDGGYEPPRIVLYGVEGWGKTTVGAYMPDPAILMAAGETGYLTIRNAGLAPNVPHVTLDSWAQTLAMVESLIRDPQGRKSIVLDALGGFERQCQQFVCDRDFKGDFGEKGFSSFQKGYELSVNEWTILLAALDRLRTTRRVAVMLIAHARVEAHRNPLGPDFDRFVADCHKKTWGATHKWSDAVLFGNFYTVVEQDKSKRNKGIGGTERVLYAQRTDAFDAKNRYGMPPVIDIPAEPNQSWTQIANAMKGIQ